MPTNNSAAKRWRQSLKRRARHRATRTEARTAVRVARDTAQSGTSEEYREALSTAYSILDTAAKKGAIPKGKADRDKRRLAALRADLDS